MLTTEIAGKHYLSIPYHDPLKPGLLAGILKSVASHHQMTMEELLRKLDL